MLKKWSLITSDDDDDEFGLCDFNKCDLCDYNRVTDFDDEFGLV